LELQRHRERAIVTFELGERGESDEIGEQKVWFGAVTQIPIGMPSDTD